MELIMVSAHQALSLYSVYDLHFLVCLHMCTLFWVITFELVLVC